MGEAATGYPCQGAVIEIRIERFPSHETSMSADSVEKRLQAAAVSISSRCTERAAGPSIERRCD